MRLRRTLPLPFIFALPLAGLAAFYYISPHIYKAVAPPVPAPVVQQYDITATMPFTSPPEIKQAGFTVKVTLKDGSHGSGVHIGDGLILTNDHVVTKNKTATIDADDGSTRQAEVLWTNPSRDVALLRVEHPETLHVADLDCRPLEVGEPVSSIGNPESMDFITMRGSVSGMAREVEGVVVQPVDVAVIPGASGGPVLSAEGKLVGLNDAYAPAYGENGPSWTTLGFIVPAAEICPLLGRL